MIDACPICGAGPIVSSWITVPGEDRMRPGTLSCPNDGDEHHTDDAWRNAFGSNTKRHHQRTREQG